MNPRPLELHTQTGNSVEVGRLTDDGGSLQLLHRLKGKIAVRHLRSKLMPKRQRGNQTQPVFGDNIRIDRYISRLEKPRTETEPDSHQTKYRRAKMLPQLSLDVSLDRKLSTDTTGAVPNRNNKMLDLIIDILKDNQQKSQGQRLCFPTSAVNHPGTPMNAPTRTKLCRFNTEPSVQYMPPQEPALRKKHGPLVLQNDFTKIGLVNARKNMLSQHRSRDSTKLRDDIKSSGNSRINIVPQQNTRIQNTGWRSMDSCSNAAGNIQLLTFYPSQQKGHFVDPQENEFMNLDELPVVRSKFSK